MLINTRRTPDANKQSLKAMMSLAAPGQASTTEAVSSPPNAADVRRSLFGCAPAEAVSFRLSLLQTGDLPDAAIASVKIPALVLCSVKDRLFPSLREGAQVVRCPLGSCCFVRPGPLGGSWLVSLRDWRAVDAAGSRIDVSRVAKCAGCSKHIRHMQAHGYSG